jgi:DMSO/TMAO reductase YedYZ molybdopterin-dependent catalytic subunit
MGASPARRFRTYTERSPRRISISKGITRGYRRSIPIEKAMDDAIVVYAQNGEAIRPAQGYPMRLLLPGWEGNVNVKWLRRIELADRPFMTRQETAK